MVPDTSPPRLGIAGEEEWALGVGAGFYVDAETGASALLFRVCAVNPGTCCHFSRETKTVAFALDRCTAPGAL